MPDASGGMSAEGPRLHATLAGRGPDGRYAWSNPAYVFMMQSVERALLTLLARNGMTSLAGKRILEIGCGTGHWLREFVKWGAQPQDVVGIDLLAERVAAARGLCAPSVQLVCGSAASLPVPDSSIDLVAQFTVFTSIRNPELKSQVAREMLRIAKPDGLILWYDFSFDNPSNPDVRGIGRREIQGLFSGCAVRLRRITLAPPLTRRLAAQSWLVCSILDAIPLLRTHFLGVIKKEGAVE